MKELSMLGMTMGRRVASIRQAVERLEAGGVVAFPTETVYGLGGLAHSPGAVRRIYRIKHRPCTNPLILHCRSLAQAQRFGQFSHGALTLAHHLWPGPLTLVVPQRSGVRPARWGPVRSTLAIRVPAHPVAQALLWALDGPLFAPSANRSGRLSPTRAEHVRLGVPVIDGGGCVLGLESTVLDMTISPPGLLRAGSQDVGVVESLLGAPLAAAVSWEQKAPGHSRHHYAPRKALRLEAGTAQDEDEIFLAFGPDYPQAEHNLSPSGDLAEAASRLFTMLHVLDGLPGQRIAVAPIPREGLGLAIYDRLSRAASL